MIHSVSWVALCVLHFGGVLGELEPKGSSIQYASVDTLAMLNIQPTHPGPDQPSPLMGLVTAFVQTNGMGFLGGPSDDRTQWLLDWLGSWPVLSGYPRTYILDEIEFQPLGEFSSRLSRLRLSLILETQGKNQRIEGYIQRLLNIHTNTENSQLEVVNIAGKSFNRLRDIRWPAWCVCEWGVVGDHYIISLGEGAAERLLLAIQDSSRQLAQDPWYKAANAQLHYEEATLGRYVNVKLLNDRLTHDAKVRWNNILGQLGLEQIERLMGTVDWAQRGITSRLYLRQSDQDRMIHISDPTLLSQEELSLIPSEATWFVAIKHDAAAVIHKVWGAYLSYCSYRERYDLRDWWDKLARVRQVNFQEEVIDQLGDTVLIHNYPVHPLRLPIMCTILIEIKGDALKVRDALDKILDYCSLQLDALAASEHRPRFLPVLRRTTEGVWYLLMGFYGPALTVTKDYLIISYSPQALQVNLASPASQAADTADAENRSEK